METTSPKPIPILEAAWMQFAQLDAAAIKRSKAHLRTRFWIGLFGVLAALLAILTQVFPTQLWGLLGLGIKAALILTPLAASGLAAWSTKNFSGGDWLIKRAGAEEILKEIYTFRTILQNSPTRRSWLENRLTEIQRQVFRGLGGELTMEPYEGPLPSNYYPDDPNSDPGFHDLTGEEYFQYRLLPQLAWHEKELNEYHAERGRLQLFIIIAGIAGAFLAAFDQTAIWVAVTASFAAAFIGWQQLRNIDAIIRNYSKVKIELQILSNHWTNLEAEERTPAEFYQMVKSTENILWSQNVEYIQSQQEALKDASLEEEAGLVNRVIQKAVESEERAKKVIAEQMESFAMDAISRGEAALTETVEAALKGLAEEANSELVQAELASMGEAISNAAEEVMEHAKSRLASSLESIAAEFDGVEIGRDTPKSMLNDLLSRYPKTSDIKG